MPTAADNNNPLNLSAEEILAHIDKAKACKEQASVFKRKVEEAAPEPKELDALVLSAIWTKLYDHGVINSTKFAPDEDGLFKNDSNTVINGMTEEVFKSCMRR